MKPSEQLIAALLDAKENGSINTLNDVYNFLDVNALEYGIALDSDELGIIAKQFSEKYNIRTVVFNDLEEDEDDDKLIADAKQLVKAFKEAGSDKIHNDEFLDEVMADFGDDDSYFYNGNEPTELYFQLVDAFEELWGSRLIDDDDVDDLENVLKAELVKQKIDVWNYLRSIGYSEGDIVSTDDILDAFNKFDIVDDSDSYYWDNIVLDYVEKVKHCSVLSIDDLSGDKPGEYKVIEDEDYSDDITHDDVIIMDAKRLVKLFKESGSDEIYISEFIDAVMTEDEDYYFDDNEPTEPYFELMDKFEELWGSRLIED